MTGPLTEGPVGVAYAEVRFTGDKAPRDVSRILDDVSDDGNAEMEDIGDKWGDTLDKHLKTSTKDTGRDVARGISAGIEREGLKITKIVDQLDPDGNVGKSWVTREIKSIEKAATEAAASGGFNKVGSIFTDAVGAGFNVSGKSPLIALLIPLVGFIAELVVGAVQAANALAAVLLTIPSLIGAIILQVGVLFLAFKGVGTAIQGAFAATNAWELNEAIKNLTPSAQKFVKSLLPLRDLFNKLSKTAQENFFARFEDAVDPISKVAKVLGNIAITGVGQIATALGGLAKSVLLFFADPVFARFLSQLIPATVRWIEDFGPQLNEFLLGLANLGSAIMPFFEWLGGALNGILGDFGRWLSSLSVDPEFLDWLDRMKVTLALAGDAIMAIVGAVKELVASLDRAGANETLQDIAAQFRQIGDFLKSEDGTKAMEGLLHIIQVLAWTLTFTVGIFLTWLLVIEVTAEFVKNVLGPIIGKFFDWLGEKIIWLVNFFKMIPVAWLAVFQEIGATIVTYYTQWFAFLGNLGWTLVQAVGAAIGWLISGLFTVAGAIATWVHDRWVEISNFAGSIGTAISNAVSNFGSLLYQAGRNVVQGLINGILSMVGSVGSAMSAIGGKISGFIPHSPAKEGPLSGSGDPFYGGEKISQRIAEGIEMGAPDISGAMTNATSNVVMGAGAVQMNFYGPTPTASQAGTIGGAAGNGLANALAQRNTRLAVRSIGAAA
jgi:hypothetical protein